MAPTSPNLDPTEDGPDCHIGPDATPLCPNCFTECKPLDQFCSRCGMPIGAFATCDPVKHIYASGWMYPRAAARGNSTLGLIGMWMIFGSAALFGAIAVLQAVLSPLSFRPDWLALIGSAILPVLSAAVLCKTTLNFLRTRRQKPGHCPKCGRRLKGLPEPRCPECGTTVEQRDVEANGDTDEEEP